MVPLWLSDENAAARYYTGTRTADYFAEPRAFPRTRSESAGLFTRVRARRSDDCEFRAGGDREVHRSIAEWSECVLVSGRRFALEGGLLKSTRLVARPFSAKAPSRTLALVSRRTSPRRADADLLAEFLVEHHRRSNRK